MDVRVNFLSMIARGFERADGAAADRAADLLELHTVLNLLLPLLDDDLVRNLFIHQTELLVGVVRFYGVLFGCVCLHLTGVVTITSTFVVLLLLQLRDVLRVVDLNRSDLVGVTVLLLRAGDLRLTQFFHGLVALDSITFYFGCGGALR